MGYAVWERKGNSEAAMKWRGIRGGIVWFMYSLREGECWTNGLVSR